MALTPNFATSQVIGSPSIVVLEDTSTGSDVAITQRRVYLQTAAGTYLVPAGTSTDYIAWSYASATKSIDALSKDYAISITVQWLNVADAVLYTKTILVDLTLYSEQFAFNLCQTESSNPSILQDDNYLMNALRLRLNIDNSQNAVDIGGNIYIAQAALDKANYLIQNQQFFF